VICDNVHLWPVHVASSSVRGYLEQVVSTEELCRLVAERPTTVRGPRRPFISASAPVDLPDADLPITPWLLGAWLGGGAARTGQLSVGHEDRHDMLRLLKEHWGGDAAVQPSSSRWNVSLSDLLTQAGLRQNKHIPVAYLRASQEQRLALLRGLMDTDGSWSAARQRAVFVTTTPALAHGVRELVHSLGGTSTLFTKDDAAKRGPRTLHTVEFRPYGYNPFSLVRKAVEVDAWFACSIPSEMDGVPRELRRTIAAVVPVEPVPTQCVMVDAPDSLYLCGDTFIPTHNTGRAPSALFEAKALFQMKFYALVLWRTRGVVPRQLQLVYLGNSEILRYSPDADELLATERKVKALWRAIAHASETGDWRPSTSRLCDWCHFQAICPAFGGTPPPLPDDAVRRASGMERETMDAPSAPTSPC
jgi:hypothetical protein